jgi:CRISPR/Cas system-associated exonuclease Cas4 (RecB family)
MSPASVSTKYRLSKSKVAAFEHCPKRLWLQIHRRHVGRFDADTLTRFQFGHDVGARARFLIPNGVMVEDVPDMQAALDRTAELIARGPIQPIFEATFQREDVLVRVDILEPDAQGGWRAIEVKASSRVRAYQLADLATQVWVMQGCRVAISRAIIRHLAAPIAWRRPDIASVRFQDADVTKSIRRYVASRAAVATAARIAIRGPEVERDMGSYCQRPFSCEFQAYCSDIRSIPLLAMAR